MVKIACVSDIHGMWGFHAGLKNKHGDMLKPCLKLENYPKADFLVFAGDILGNYATCRGDYSELAAQLNEVEALNAFCKELKQKGIYKEIIVVAGNHDWAFEKTTDLCRSRITDAIYLQDEVLNIAGPDGQIIKIYGSPWQPWFYDWAFNFPNHYKDPKRAATVTQGCWAKIPDDVDVLITHGPPENILDECMDTSHVGCRHLRERIKSLRQLKLHVFGHIHWSRGQIKQDNTLFVNAAVCTENYRPDNAIQVVEF